MRMSCNGCRVLRKGCSDNCSIRPCLQWIKSPESQANATVFLAKFYGRAGLMNLINAAGPDHLRPAIFRSLLYEACGRIVNPIYGSVGLLWSGSWQLCQAAVEAVLKGEPIMQVSAETAASPSPSPPLKACDIRHVSKEENVVTQELHKVKSRTHFKRSAKPKPKTEPVDGSDQPNNTDSAQVCNLRWRRCYPDDYNHHASESSSQTELNVEAETDSMFSNETVDASRADPGAVADDSGSEIELELTLGLEPISHATRVHAARVIKPEEDSTGDCMDRCRIELGLHIAE